MAPRDGAEKLQATGDRKIEGSDGCPAQQCLEEVLDKRRGISPGEGGGDGFHRGGGILNGNNEAWFT